MSLWKNISLYKYQRIDKINNQKGIDQWDKILFSVCEVFGLTEFQLDSLSLKKDGIKKVAKLTNKVSAIFASELRLMPVKRLGYYSINYDAGSMRFGQYVELSFFLQQPIEQAAHRVLASISHVPFFKNDSGKHGNKSEYFLSQPIEKVLGTVKLFIERFTAFNKEYTSLFGLSEEIEDAEEKQTDRFNKTYGWQYSAEVIAKYERITLSEAYELPVRQALNALTYLKAKGEYELRQIKSKK